MAIIIEAPAVARVSGRRDAARVGISGGQLGPGRNGAGADGGRHVCVDRGPIPQLAISIVAPAVADVGGRRDAARVGIARCQLCPGRHSASADGRRHICFGAAVSIPQLAITIVPPAVAGVGGRRDAAGVVETGGQLGPGRNGASADGCRHVCIGASVPTSQLAIIIVAPSKSRPLC